jgi:lycopene cyclase domain-containing protein
MMNLNGGSPAFIASFYPATQTHHNTQMLMQFTYLFILVASLAGPLALSFDKKVAFFIKWKYAFQAMMLPALFYIAWDIYFTYLGIWSFNEDQITGIYVFNIPLEEALFFYVVPFCCLFIYECTRRYFPQVANQHVADIMLKCLGIALFIIGIIFFKNRYTGWTCILTAVFIGVIYFAREYFKSFDAGSFLTAYAIMIIPFLVVNGFLTAIPVVSYNNAEHLNRYIFTIPVEDIFYGMLLIMMNIVIYEKIKERSA